MVKSKLEACLVCTGSGYAPTLTAQGAGAPASCPHCEGTGKVAIRGDAKKDIVKIVYESERGKPPMQPRRKPRG